MMRREGISLRSTAGGPQIPRLRLLQSKSKRPNNAKITIYSTKYTSLMSTQSLPQDYQHVFCTFCGNLATNSTLKSQSKGKFGDSMSQQHFGENHSESYYQPLETKVNDQPFLAKVREEIDKARNLYQGKMRDLFEANSRTISELKQTLCQQQRKLAEKDRLINQLLGQRRIPLKRANSDPYNDSPNRKPNASKAQYNFFKDRMQDLQIKLSIVLDALSKQDQATADKLQKLQQRLIRYNGNRINQCKLYMQNTINMLNNKLDSYGHILNKEPAKRSNINVQIISLKKQVEDLKTQIKIISHKQFHYQSSPLLDLQTTLASLKQKLFESSCQATRKSEHFLQDDDQFFYPQSERLYEPNDDYEHFQEESEEQKQKKENKSPNNKLGGFKFTN